MASDEGRVQAMAGCQSDTARLHTSGEEDSSRKHGRTGMGGVPGTLRCMIASMIKEDVPLHL